jgi:hypothetical protein
MIWSDLADAGIVFAIALAVTLAAVTIWDR